MLKNTDYTDYRTLKEIILEERFCHGSFSYPDDIEIIDKSVKGLYEPDYCLLPSYTELFNYICSLFGSTKKYLIEKIHDYLFNFATEVEFAVIRYISSMPDVYIKIE